MEDEYSCAAAAAMSVTARLCLALLGSQGEASPFSAT